VRRIADKLGVWDAAFETLASFGPRPGEELAIHRTIVRAHQHAAGGKECSKSGSARPLAWRLDPLVFAPVDLFACVVAARSASFGRFDALAVDDRAGRTGFASGSLATPPRFSRR